MTSRLVQRAPDRSLTREHLARRAGKRAFDLAAAVTLLAVLLPLLVAIGVLVRMTTPGRALFRQRRLGLHARPFVLYKFRTMYDGCPDEPHRAYVRQLLTTDAPPAGATGLYKLGADPRVTRVGRLLRRTSIDELPQLLNVIRGDMSLVGPRPALPWESEMFGAYHRQRFLVLPGVTGLWQVSGRNQLTMRQSLDLDVEYVRRQRFALDLAILLRTLPVVLSTRGAG
jgi:lipopolysaccharide/colanic/teichoic acid biosynthesis glycosyltransferase